MSRCLSSFSGIAQNLLRGRRPFAWQLHQIGHVTVAVHVAAQHFDAPAFGRQSGSRPWLKSPDALINLPRAHLPRKFTIFPAKSPRNSGRPMVLLDCVDLREVRERFNEELCTD